MNKLDRTAFLPVSKEDMAVRGIEQLDFVYISGDAYVDHPSFGNGDHLPFSKQTVSRSVLSHSRTGATPVHARRKLGFLVCRQYGSSMVNHYSVAKKRRRTHAFSPRRQNGQTPGLCHGGLCNLIRRSFKKTPILIGGIEASLRRLAHYDYWSDKMKRSVLLDSGADIISYGMGERSIVEIAEALRSGIPMQELTFIRGTVYKRTSRPTATTCSTFPASIKFPPVKSCTRKAFTISISTPTRSRRKRPSSPTRTITCSSCRILRRCRFRPKKWMTPTPCPIRAPITRITKPSAASPAIEEVFLPAAAGASAHAASAR